MDLWETSVSFLCSRVTADQFLVSDLIGLAFKWGITLRSRPTQGGGIGGNGKNQVTLVFRDLLVDLKARYPDITSHTLTHKLTEVKKFSHLGPELREVLFEKALTFVEKAGKTIADNKKEISTLTHQVSNYKGILERSNSPSQGILGDLIYFYN